MNNIGLQDDDVGLPNIGLHIRKHSLGLHMFIAWACIMFLQYSRQGLG